MKNIENRIKNLEAKAGIDKEPILVLVIIKNYANGKSCGDDSLECAVFEKDEVSLCPEYHKVKPDLKNPFMVFSPPCDSCKEPVKK